LAKQHCTKCNLEHDPRERKCPKPRNIQCAKCNWMHMSNAKCPKNPKCDKCHQAHKGECPEKLLCLNCDTRHKPNQKCRKEKSKRGPQLGTKITSGQLGSTQKCTKWGCKEPAGCTKCKKCPDHYVRGCGWFHR
jgi:hypothetical protein